MIIDKIDQNMPFVRKNNFRLLFPDIKESSFDQDIKNWLGKGKLIALKRGLYVFSSYWDKCQDKDGYLNYLSLIIYGPSYISRETVLAREGMLGEAVYGISAISSKTSRTFVSKIGLFSYSKIKPELFSGFKEQYFFGNKYYVATLAKALFDYLYYYKRELKEINEQIIGELRINFEVMTRQDWREFEKYLKIASSKKLKAIYAVIKEKYAA